MARDRITSSTRDIMSDSGSVLLSVVSGEQLEFPIILDFVDVADDNYTYEAVLLEGVNDGLGTLPTEVEPGGLTAALNVRICNHVGEWASDGVYNREDVVDYDGVSYRLLNELSYTNNTSPDKDPEWTYHDKRTIYVQFSSALTTSLAYSVIPKPDIPVYGFFELKVSEVYDSIFVDIRKPVRGLVEFLFSPTALI